MSIVAWCNHTYVSLATDANRLQTNILTFWQSIAINWSLWSWVCIVLTIFDKAISSIKLLTIYICVWKCDCVEIDTCLSFEFCQCFMINGDHQRLLNVFVVIVKFLQLSFDVSVCLCFKSFVTKEKHHFSLLNLQFCQKNSFSMYVDFMIMNAAWIVCKPCWWFWCNFICIFGK